MGSRRSGSDVSHTLDMAALSGHWEPQGGGCCGGMARLSFYCLKLVWDVQGAIGTLAPKDLVTNWCQEGSQAVLPLVGVKQ